MKEVELRDVCFNQVSKDTDQNLCWNVFVKDFNLKEIVVRNIFEYNIGFINELINIYKEHKKEPLTPTVFGEKVRNALMHEYWSRCEYETVVTSWPPFVYESEIDRLNMERKEHIEKWGNFYCANVNLSIGTKIDVFTQILLNWEQFINYLWNNIDLIKKLKKVR